MDLAAQHNRPVNVHAVQCHGHLLKYFAELAERVPKDRERRKKKTKGQADEQEETKGVESVDHSERDSTYTHPSPTQPVPPTILLHSFSGSSDIVRSLLRLAKPFSSRIFFSFSAAINSRSAKCHDRIVAVPDDRILIESDLHDASMVDDAMWAGLKMVAEAKGWALEETVERVEKNVEEYLVGWSKR
ncbi:hypothetical protein HDV00_004008 [Rhizophlyctis rosea]|nr:hypothetical protein HDV00_004008 [Rhizophlyctis rosea]